MESTNLPQNASLWGTYPDTEDSTDSSPCCRVCHSENEVNRPLYHPCRCDGSIKFVHQDCLVEWVRVSRQSEPKCELCGEKFHFKNVYASDAPIRLSLIEFLCGLIPRFIEQGRGVMRAGFLAVSWFIFLPIFTSWWLDLCTSFVLDTDIPFNPMDTIFNSLSQLISTWWNGFAVTAMILLISIGVTQVVAIFSEVNKVCY